MPDPECGERERMINQVPQLQLLPALSLHPSGGCRHGEGGDGFSVSCSTREYKCYRRTQTLPGLGGTCGEAS